jgi:phage tail sheath protein FI
VNAFMQTLFTQGAFQGATPSAAYFVKCDNTTITPDDMENGIVNIVIGFAPINPAEFVTLTVRQTTLVS